MRELWLMQQVLSVPLCPINTLNGLPCNPTLSIQYREAVWALCDSLRHSTQQQYIVLCLRVALPCGGRNIQLQVSLAMSTAAQFDRQTQTAVWSHLESSRDLSPHLHTQ